MLVSIIIKSFLISYNLIFKFTKSNFNVDYFIFTYTKWKVIFDKQVVTLIDLNYKR